MSTIASSIPAASLSRRTETGVRRLMWAVSILAAVALACHFALILWAQNAFSGPESVIAGNSTRLAHDGILYNDLKHYPYTVSAYMPIFYSLEAVISKTGIPPATAGRLVSFAAFLGILALSRRIVLHYARDVYCAWLAVLLIASTSLVEYWGTTGQTDTLAVFWSMAAFYCFSRRWLVAAGTFAALAFFTKQTMLASSAAIFVLLWMERPKTALRFGAILAACVAATALAIDHATSGSFFTDTVRGNMNPLSIEKLKQHAVVLIGAGQMMLILAAGIQKSWRASRDLLVYLAFATAVLLLTAAKIGSDTNYQIEFTIVLTLCAVVTLHAVDFFPLTFAGSKRWITLLQIPLAVHLALNFRMTKNLLQERIAVEQQFRSEVAALRPYVGAGPLLSADYNASIRLQGTMQVEPLIYNMLVNSGVIDPEPVRRDLAAERFATIILFEDLNHPDPTRDAETSTLPPAQLEQIRKHYHLVAHLNSPYPSGVYVYKPPSTP